MTKPISEYTVDELSAKIGAIKAEREWTANALKRYEEELERRKQEVPLGVPCRDKDADYYITLSVRKINEQPYYIEGYYCHSKESAEKHAEMLSTWRKALVANSKGEPIDITVLLPLMRKGWVAMDKNGHWYWYEDKPKQSLVWWIAEKPNAHLFSVNVKPAENWEESLMECGL